MNKGLLNKKIPTVFGMIIIILGLSVTILATNRQTSFMVGAQVNTQPQGVRITNITDKSFTVSYTTISPTSGFIKYGTDDALGNTSFDEQDTTSKLQDHIIHSFSIKNLSPQTKYYFTITSGQETYLDNNKSFELTTASVISVNKTTENVNGKVILSNANPPKEAIVYLTIDNAQVLSSVVKKDGTYSINLDHLLDSNLSEIAELSKQTVIQMLILGDSLSSNAKIYHYQAGDVPTITLSNNYDFLYLPQENSSTSANFNSFPTLKNVSSKKEDNLKILTPEKNQTFNDQAPSIKGTAQPDQQVDIQIHSKQLLATTVTTDSSGNWVYQPTSPLSPGTHTVTVSAKDSSGIVKTITQSFTVNAQEISPTLTPSSTITPSISPTVTASPTISAETLPVAGNPSIIAAGIAGLLISIAGGLIFLISHKGI